MPCVYSLTQWRGTEGGCSQLTAWTCFTANILSLFFHPSLPPAFYSLGLTLSLSPPPLSLFLTYPLSPVSPLWTAHWPQLLSLLWPSACGTLAAGQRRETCQRESEREGEKEGEREGEGERGREGHLFSFPVNRTVPNESILPECAFVKPSEWGGFSTRGPNFTTKAM